MSMYCNPFLSIIFCLFHGRNERKSHFLGAFIVVTTIGLVFAAGFLKSYLA